MQLQRIAFHAHLKILTTHNYANHIDNMIMGRGFPAYCSASKQPGKLNTKGFYFLSNDVICGELHPKGFPLPTELKGLITYLPTQTIGRTPCCVGKPDAEKVLGGVDFISRKQAILASYPIGDLHLGLQR